MKFAKLYDIGDDQLLVTKDYDDEDNLFSLKVTTQFDGVSYSMYPSFSSEEDRDEAFNAFDLKMANTHYKAIEQIFK